MKRQERRGEKQRGEGGEQGVREKGKEEGRGRKEGGRKEGREGQATVWDRPLVVHGWWCRAVIVHTVTCRPEWGGCTLITMAAGGGSLSIHGHLCTLVVVGGRVVSWWVLAAVHGYGVGGWS
jgi:hypothetical protein